MASTLCHLLVLFVPCQVVALSHLLMLFIPCQVVDIISFVGICSSLVKLWTISYFVGTIRPLLSCLNIYFSGFLAFIVVAIYFFMNPPNDVESFQWPEKAVFSLFFAGAILCLGFSWMFHTVYCHSEKVGLLFSKWVTCCSVPVDVWAFLLFLVMSCTKCLFYAERVSIHWSAIYVIYSYLFSACQAANVRSVYYVDS